MGTDYAPTRTGRRQPAVAAAAPAPVSVPESPVPLALASAPSCPAMPVGEEAPRPGALANLRRLESGDASAASRSAAGSTAQLPFIDKIQTAFGHHDLGDVRARLDSAAASESRALGAKAFTLGTEVAFDGRPDLHTAAHEAAHVVQQRRGAVTGANERALEDQADGIADRVVAGQSAAEMLDRVPGTGTPVERVQRKTSDVLPFQTTLTAKLSALGAAISSHADMARLFVELFPEGQVDQLPALLGLDGLLSVDKEDSTTTILLDRKAGTGRLEITVTHPFFHIFLNDLYWTEDAEKPAPWLFLHKWDRDTKYGQQGVGLAVFRGMRTAAAVLGMSQINCDAIGDPTTGVNPENGYYTWARFGFNNDLSIDTFRTRLSTLDGEIATLPAELEKLEKLEKLAAEHGVESLTMTDEERSAELLTWENLIKQGDNPDERTQASIDFLRQWTAVRRLKAAKLKYGEALDYAFSIVGPDDTLNDLFTKPETKEGRRMMANLWQGFGSTVMNASFTVAEGSASNKVLQDYIDDRS